MTNMLTRNIKILSHDDILKIHKSTLRVLKETGVIFQHENALNLLEKAGARVNGEVVKFPEEMVENLIKIVPHELILPARKPEKNIHLGVGRVHYTNGYGATFVRDLETGVCRKARLEDLINFTRLGDYLDNVHYVLTQVIPQDISPEIVDVVQSAEMLRHTQKHVGLSIVKATFIDEIIQIGRYASGLNETKSCRNAVFSLGAVSLSPLKFSWDGCYRLMRMAENEVIIRITSLPISGATSPVTMAGTLVQANAEALAGICLVQVINPGNPVIYGFSGGPLDMNRGKRLSGSPEAPLMDAAIAQMCDFYKIPFGYGSGGSADSSVPDQQSGIERVFTILFAALAGVDVIHHAAGGLLGGSMVSSYEEMIIANEICNMINRGLRGIRVTDDTVAVDVIREVGPGGTYLDTDHTLHHFREELFLSNLLDRRSHNERGENEPSLMPLRAKELAKHILENHVVPGFTPYVEERIHLILDQVAKKVSSK
jgi:trimethylamine--corrinoid protein Co-methyltransferase